MRANHPLSRIEYQVMWNRLISVVEEQAQTLIRTAFGTVMCKPLMRIRAGTGARMVEWLT